MHLFDYDSELRNKSELLYPLFPISRKIQLNESYCEIWARVLNCCVISVLNNVDLDHLLEKERKHSLQQMVNVLHYMSIKYPQLMDKNTVYKENTNSFAYLFIPAQVYVGKFIGTFKDYPPSQSAAAFNLDEVMKKMSENQGSK
jgi:hypothetical protein